jgi:hypothetical protein
VQVIVSFADLPQRPACAFTDVDALVIGCGDQGRGQTDERFLLRPLVMNSEDGNPLDPE